MSDDTPKQDSGDGEPIDAEFAEVQGPPRERHGGGFGFLAFILAIILGAALGAGAAWYLDPGDLGLPGQQTAAPDRDLNGSARLRSLADDLEALEARVEDTEAGGANEAARERLTALEESLQQLSNRVENEIATEGDQTGFDPSDIEDRLDDIETRIDSFAEAAENGESAPAFDASAFERRIAELEAGYSDLEDRDAELEARAADLEDAQDTAESFDPAPLTRRLSALEDRIEALEAEEPAEIADDPRVDGLQTRLQQTRTSVAQLERRLAAVETAPGGSGAAQTAFLYGALREAALTGKTFQLELAALENEIDAPALGVLRPLAARGVATERELLSALPAAEIRNAQAKDDTLQERARSVFGSLGSVRRADEAPMQTDHVATARAALEDGGLTAAIEAMEQLKGEALDAAQGWLDAARAREQAEEALNDLRDQMMETAP